ncbi:MAG TPA: sigma-70 family RNA polymerase sigma factor [Phycisphaerae bacterium]|nr:sigma-70 family RNA polymerase sigma factor [Phycisphaerae bacterium]HRY67060.1 sigma-70 family RNA polymerase sigma factor [Phycisphaerae bacterium]HSA27757.1 sigma-70 family RNA polymerase sigma factor [Phycisphaerae bacterium]
MDEDEILIQRVIKGDVGAFRPLVERYQRPVLRFIANIAGNRHLSEDVAQEVFLAAYRAIRSFDPDRSRFVTWLFTIARNRTLTAMRKRQDEYAAELPDQVARDGPGDDAERAELYGALDKALAGLPFEQRTAFVLAEFEELTYEEIARTEQTNVGTVRSRIGRAREKLRQVLHEYGEGR